MPGSFAARISVAVAAGLALADASIVTLGLPAILIELDTTVEGVALVLGVYTVVLAAAAPLAIRVSRAMGAATVGAAGIVLFGVASLVCGLVDSLSALLALRAVQAVGGGATLVAAFLLLDGAKPGPGRSLWIAASVFGAAVGPALGGALTEAFDWRAIFLAQVPLIAPGAVVAIRAAGQGKVHADGSTAAAPAGEEPSGPSPRSSAPGRPPRSERLAPLAALGLVSAALTAAIFLVVLLLVAGWSVRPLAAALIVTVLPLAALAGSRIPGDPRLLAATGSLLMAGGIACLALLPGASPAWTIVPQLLAGAGMGMALPALAGEILPERTGREAARLMSVRHLGIALSLALLAPIVSSTLEDTIASAREQGAAALLDSPLGPDRKFDLAPPLFAGIDTDDPRDQLERAFAEQEERLEGDDAREVAELGDRLDGIVTGAVRDAFRPAFIATAAFAALAALILLAGPLAAQARASRGRLTAAGAAAVLAAGAYGAFYASADRDRVAIADPCAERGLPGSGGVTGFLQDQAIEAIDRAACEFGSSREELLLALFDAELRERYIDRHDVDPRSITELGPALLGL